MFFVLVYKLVFFLLYDVPVQINVTIFDSICRDDVINREFIPIRLIQSFAMIIITRTCNLNIVLNEWPAYIICGKNFISYFFLFSLNVKGYISDLTNLSNGSNIWPRIKNIPQYGILETYLVLESSDNGRWKTPPTPKLYSSRRQPSQKHVHNSTAK